VTQLTHKLSIAPMIDWTNSYFRILMRLLAPNALLYTEMLTTQAIMHQSDRCLFYTPIESPLALQLGGSDPQALAQCALWAEDRGYSEININVGCPSDRVQSGRFGACLMKEPDVVARCVAELKKAVRIPVTIKTRIGIDHLDSYEFFSTLVQSVVEAGCDKLIVHARKAWLKGLSPKQNRTVPQINYDFVYRIKQDFKDLPVIINGNIQTIDDVHTHLNSVEGVMIGRLAYQNPFAIAEIHHTLYPEVALPVREDIVQAYRQRCGHDLHSKKHYFVVKPLQNLYHGLPGARLWRRSLEKES
jgi:tRNA-dihydrouridine synthase A